MTHLPLTSAHFGAVVAALAILIGTATPAYGQPLFGDLDSIEWMAADSSLIVRGTIETLSMEKELDGSLWHTMRFRVEETLKGEHQPSVQFVMQSNDVRPRKSSSRAPSDTINPSPFRTSSSTPARCATSAIFPSRHPSQTSEGAKCRDQGATSTVTLGKSRFL